MPPWVGGLMETSQDRLAPNGGDCKGNGTPKISGKSRLVKYYSIWPDISVLKQKSVS